jgi:4-hydroxymandelate oxidase
VSAFSQDWGLRRIARQRFAQPAQLSTNEGHLSRFQEFTGDLLAPFQLDLGPFEGRGQSYGEMGEAVIRQLIPAGEQADLLILVYAVPDIAPGRATATYLSYVCPGNPLSFAICDQGTAAAFTGLRLVREYARTGEARRSVLLIVEQADLPYDAGVPVTLPAAHAAVALLFGDAPAATVGEVHVRTSEVVVAGTAIASVAAAKHADLSTMDDLISAPQEQPYTGVWWELAQTLENRRGQFTLADYDQQLGYLSTAVFSASDQVSVSTR